MTIALLPSRVDWVALRGVTRLLNENARRLILNWAAGFLWVEELGLYSVKVIE